MDILYQLASSQYYMRCAAVTAWATVASTTLFFCDYLSTLAEEISLIWPGLFEGLRCGKVLFLVCRYTAFIDMPVATAGHLLFGYSPPIALFSSSVSFFGVLASEGIVILTLYALMGAKKKHATLLLTLFTPLAIGVLAFVVLDFTGWEALTIDETMGVSPGTGPRSVSIRGMDVCFWILLLGQSLVVVIAFSSGIRSYRRTKCPLLVTLYKDGTVYYVVLLAFSALNVMAPYIVSPYYTNVFTPLQRVAHAILANRLIFNARRYKEGLSSGGMAGSTGWEFNVESRSDPVGRGGEGDEVLEYYASSA
ncbi:hypothetical protein CC1G_12224 [Coprinopsis cinerea okayama7|uniref:DUF6533 domain-containing protein n=1 Tax=Coprinopsis cinerea (strain Okayama-7 / 130 / ATCC MYA-4618 / FGSC 9003) TaxID=240176 RepID=A8NA48_COPC7|nr:hypothetical protein CC1G_12224 [Coprinopsis cinerea okayama7\|eukprot:XP_001831704.2 hypothetical protein CC1G_12224 [Coprinopsis cinerea okayama7\